MNKEDMRWVKEQFDKDDELILSQPHPSIDASKVYKRMYMREISLEQLAKSVGLSLDLTDLLLQLEVFPQDKIDILASTLSTDKGELL